MTNLRSEPSSSCPECRAGPLFIPSDLPDYLEYHCPKCDYVERVGFGDAKMAEEPQNKPAKSGNREERVDRYITYHGARDLLDIYEVYDRPAVYGDGAQLIATFRYLSHARDFVEAFIMPAG